MIKKQKIYVFIKYGALFTAVLFVFFNIYHAAMLSIDAHHDGTVFNPALVISRGGTLFIDESTYYGPFTVYIQALFLKVFGETIWAMRLSAVVFYTLSFIMFYNIFKRFIPRVLVLVAEGLLLYIAPFWMTSFHAWSSVYALFFYLFMIWAFLRFYETDKYYYIGLAGMGSICILWTRTPAGIVAVLGFLLLFLIWRMAGFFQKFDTKKILIYYLAGCLLVFGPLFVYMLINGTLDDWWRICIQGTFSRFAAPTAVTSTAAVGETQAVHAGLAVKSSIWNIIKESRVITFLSRLLEDLFPVKQSGIFIVLPFAGLYLFFSELCVILKNRKNFSWEIQKKSVLLLTVALFSLAQWHQYWPVSEIRHWYWGGFTLMGSLAYAVWYRGKEKNKWVAVTISSAILLILSANTLQERGEYYHIRKDKYVVCMREESSPYLKGLKFSAEQSLFYTDYCELVELIHEAHPERRIINETFSVLLTSINRNNEESIDDSKTPIIMSTDRHIENFPEHYLAVVLEQQYPEQELDSRIWTIYVYFPIQ